MAELKPSCPACGKVLEGWPEVYDGIDLHCVYCGASLPFVTKPKDLRVFFAGLEVPMKQIGPNEWKSTEIIRVRFDQ